ncbi:molybdopterin-dependent oxidoreductase [Baekduia alba]|uniref:molybdopterin-dependent oxidoreductase n=1 Tax=Baekduia alba TaxID=2997333 RepID=UPI0023416EF7|nr:molybdopterin-dependent oxidoreductase [Baekduia alba]
MPGPTSTSTLCPYCGTGCGLSVDVEGGRVRGVAGDARHPVNRGRTCRKPLELGSAVHAADRPTTPLVRASRDLPFASTSWDDAIDGVAARLRAIVDESGPDAIAFYVSGQLLTEDYYAVNKLAKGFLGTNNVDSNSRLCMSSAVAGYTGAFGADGPPPAYADLAAADCLLLLGSNTAACHPIVWSRIRDRQAEGARVIVVDPRATPTAIAADLHLAVRPGTDLPLLNAMLCVLERDGLLDRDFIARHTSGFDATMAVARAWPVERAAQACGVAAADIERAAEWFGAAGAAMTLWSMGANQSAVGTLKNRALINLCLATGNLGRPGCGPLSLTGQPNAMGGREVGGLAHLLPGYRRVDDGVDRAAMEAHWGLEAGALSAVPGLTATEVVDALLDGRVRAVLVAATNPVVSLPDGARVREAFERCELLVVQDCHHPTETSALAHVVLPAAAWPEKEGSMTSSERRVGLVRKLLDAPGEARPDWQIYAGLARALGFGDAFAWPDAAAVYDEFAATTAGRPCDVSGVSHARLRREGSVQWPAPAALVAGATADGTVRLYEDRRPPTPDRRARFGPAPHSAPADAPDPEFPMTLTTGRVADQWHTMSRTGKSSALRAAAGVPTLSVHPEDGKAYGLVDGDDVRVRSRRRGEVVLRAAFDATLPRGVAFAPFHWGAAHAPAGAGAVNAVSHATVDPTSKQPELKAMAVALEPARGRAARRGADGPRRRLVVVGTGMAALATVEEVLRRDPDGWRITMLGEEPGPVYNRIMLSKLLAGECGPGDLEVKPLAWYAQRGIDLRGDCPAVAIDTTNKVVRDLAGGAHRYDTLVVATGSRAFVPPLAGADLPHVGVFRTWADVAALSGTPVAGRRAVVLGGGLLGLEAAAGLHARGARVTVVEPAPRLMGRQLDDASASMLGAALRARGIALRVGVLPERITPDAVVLDGGDATPLPADLVVVAAGVRPETTLAREAGLPVARGIVVDDALRAGAPGVFAVGECAEHQGMVYGLWAPLAEQARVAGATIAGDPAAFHPQTTATVLKVAGVDVYAGGVAQPEDHHDEVTLRDTRSGRYRKLVLDGDRLVGAILVGDVADARRCSAALRSHDPTDAALIDAGFGAVGAEAPPPAPDATICSCNAVTAGAIDRAIAARGLTTVAGVAKATRASTGCGGCAGEVRAILERHRSSARNTSDSERQPPSPTIAA